MKINIWIMLKDILPVLLMFWPVWLALIILFLTKILFEVVIPKWRNNNRFWAGKKWRSDRELLQSLQKLTPTEFENYIANLFSHLGYNTKAVGQSHDGGIDVVVEKNRVVNYIQCKKYITSTVPVGAVRDFYGALADHLANGKGYFITTNKFTLEAENFAKDKPIELIDGLKLIHYIHMYQSNSR